LRRCWGAVVVVFFEPSLPVYLLFYLSLSFIPFLTMHHILIQTLSTPKGEFLEPPQSSKTIIASGYEFRPGFIAMVQEQPFSGFSDENPYHHLLEFEQLCAFLTTLQHI
jgi:hypothetical protein